MGPTDMVVHPCGGKQLPTNLCYSIEVQETDKISRTFDATMIAGGDDDWDRIQTPANYIQFNSN